jgi:hypothetical protein
MSIIGSPSFRSGEHIRARRYDVWMKVRAFLADSVQSVDGKLYVLGAGWNRLTASGFPAQHDRVGIGILMTVEAGEAGEHNLEVSLLDERDLPVPLFADPTGTEQFALNASFQTQPPDDGLGDVQVPLALNLNGLSFPTPGTYTFSFRVNGAEAERLPFRVSLVTPTAAGDPGAPPGTSTAPGTPEPGYL